MRERSAVPWSPNFPWAASTFRPVGFVCYSSRLRIMGIRGCNTEATSTESTRSGDGTPTHVFGIFWVVPEVRFDPLRSSMLFGRASSCTVQLEAQHVSREHAVMEQDGPLWLLRDLQSKNGTWVNARRQQLASLQEQDVLRIGGFVGVLCSLPLQAAATGQLFETPVPGFVLSAATRAALGPLEVLATRQLPLLVRGETGTGKELVVRAIHELSQRRGRLVAVNCAAIPEAMAESLLFGHRKGAFTGAQGCAEGHVQAAQGGTLFLDEVADLPLVVQAKLLRVLEERKVTPLGATEAVSIDFRLVSACQEPLSEAVAGGDFRQDLYARLKGAEISIPPLRARRQEVVALLSACFREGGAVPDLDARLVEALCVYDWPHNARELKQLAGLLGSSGKQLLSFHDLPRALRLVSEGAAGSGAASAPARSVSQRRQAWLSRHGQELDQLLRALRKHAGNISLAAVEAGVPRHRARRLLAADAERVDAEQ
ncbi:MAG: sigma 54-interacting transcriptional regulator [Deltaproteobacteria bacterium]